MHSENMTEHLSLYCLRFPFRPETYTATTGRGSYTAGDLTLQGAKELQHKLTDTQPWHIITSYLHTPSTHKATSSSPWGSSLLFWLLFSGLLLHHVIFSALPNFVCPCSVLGRQHKVGLSHSLLKTAACYCCNKLIEAKSLHTPAESLGLSLNATSFRWLFNSFQMPFTFISTLHIQ